MAWVGCAVVLDYVKISCRHAAPELKKTILKMDKRGAFPTKGSVGGKAKWKEQMKKSINCSAVLTKSGHPR